MNVSGIKILAFDADDTLWENEPMFRQAEADWLSLMSDYGDPETLYQALFEVESANIPVYGYGAKPFTLNMLEAGFKVTGGNLSPAIAAKMIEVGRNLLFNPAEPMPHVVESLEKLSSSGRFRMIVLTKGDLLDQEQKLHRSGLLQFFERIVIVSKKTRKEYLQVCSDMSFSMDEMLMVGNSFKSDIDPVLQLGGSGVFIPFRVLWAHEHMEPYSHPRLVTLASIRDLSAVLLG